MSLTVELIKNLITPQLKTLPLGFVNRFKHE